MINFYVTILLLLVEVDFYKLFLFTQEIFCFVEFICFYFKLSIRKILSMKKMKYLQNQTTLF